MKNITSLEVTDLFNSILRKHNIEIKLKEYVDLDFYSEVGVVKWFRTDLEKLFPEDKISAYLKKTAFKQVDITKQRFYHYLPKKSFLDEIKKTECIRLYNLNKYLKDNGDELEYRHFLNNFGINFPKFEEQITNIKDNIFIWCLTDNFNSAKQRVNSTDGGVVIEIKSKYLESEPNIVELCTVCYSLDFLEEIQSSLKEKYCLRLEIAGFPLFAKFFKKKYLDWERETRLSFDKTFWDIDKFGRDFFKHIHLEKTNIDKLFSVKVDSEKNEKYILIPISNNFFEIEIIKEYAVYP